MGKFRNPSRSSSTPAPSETRGQVTGRQGALSPSGLAPACHRRRRSFPALPTLVQSSLRRHDGAHVAFLRSSPLLAPVRMAFGMVCATVPRGSCISIPPQPCAAAIRLASPRSCPPIHPRAAATLLVGLGSRFRRHDRAGTVHSAHGDALRRRRAHHVTAPGGDEIFRHGSTMAPPLTGCSLSKI